MGTILLWKLLLIFVARRVRNSLLNHHEQFLILHNLNQNRMTSFQVE